MTTIKFLDPILELSCESQFQPTTAHPRHSIAITCASASLKRNTKAPSLRRCMTAAPVEKGDAFQVKPLLLFEPFRRMRSGSDEDKQVHGDVVNVEEPNVGMERTVTDLENMWNENSGADFKTQSSPSLVGSSPSGRSSRPRSFVVQGSPDSITLGLPLIPFDTSPREIYLPLPSPRDLSAAADRYTPPHRSPPASATTDPTSYPFPIIFVEATLDTTTVEKPAATPQTPLPGSISTFVGSEAGLGILDGMERSAHDSMGRSTNAGDVMSRHSSPRHSSVAPPCKQTLSTPSTRPSSTGLKKLKGLIKKMKHLVQKEPEQIKYLL